MAITLLIDGYNLLHATGALHLVRGASALGKARNRMLSQIAGSLSAADRVQTQVVFDARRSKSNELESQVVLRGMTVTYSVGFAEADDLIEQIIRQHPHPKTLTVVSSDLRIQRCATARKATSLGCDQFLMQLLDVPDETTEPESAPEQATEPKAELSPEEVQKWLREFGL